MNQTLKASAAKTTPGGSELRADDEPSTVPELSEQELLAVAGGMMDDTHVHMSCCNDCHSQLRCKP
jgi:hypothetical protein